jgi:hypothetical protein
MATDYIVVDGESVVMVGEPFVLRELGKDMSEQCKLVRIETYGLVILDSANIRKCVQFENVAEVNGLDCAGEESIKVHRS